MIINFYGHGCCKLKGKSGSVVCDPFHSFVGFDLPKLSADIVTVSSDNPGYNNYPAVTGTARREKPFIIDYPGEYEVDGVSVFGVKTYRDQNQGVENGVNIVYTFLLDDLRVCHLGSLGHELSEKQIHQIGLVDILFVPVGNQTTLDPKAALKVARSLEPNILIPIHYKTRHDEKVFADLGTLEQFLQVSEHEPERLAKLNIEKASLPEEMEIFVLQES